MALRVKELATKPNDLSLIPCLIKEKTDSYSDPGIWEKQNKNKNKTRAPIKGFVSSIITQDLEIRALGAEMQLKS